MSEIQGMDTIPDEIAKGPWGDASYNFARTTKGDVVTLTATSNENTVWARREVRGLLDAPDGDIGKVNGRDWIGNGQCLSTARSVRWVVFAPCDYFGALNRGVLWAICCCNAAKL